MKQDGRHLLKKYLDEICRGGYIYDDISGKVLDGKLVEEAKQLELRYFRDMKVYDYVDRREIQATGGKLIGTKWVITNKGDAGSPDIRARLVGKEFRTEADDSPYASTPPLEALRCLLSSAATVDGGDKEPRGVMVSDVRRAYFYAKATSDIFIEIPEQDSEKRPGQVVKLRLCLYGTRGAAVNWQETLSKHLVDNGFVRGRGHPAVFWHAGRRLRTLVHGDDYVSVGPQASVE